MSEHENASGSAPEPAISKSMEAEIEAAMKAATEVAEQAPKKIRGPRVVQSGREHRSGHVVAVGATDVFLEFGPKELGVLPKTQIKEGTEPPAVGSQLEVVIDRFDAGEQVYLCSLPGAVQKAEWELLEPGQVVEARVTGQNKGGLELEVAGHRAFMPASQVDFHRIEDLSVFVGEKMACKVIRVDRGGRGNITLSRRDIIAEQREQMKHELREKLAEGMEVEGIVKSIMPFGAFVDIGGVDALLHISDMSHDRINKPESVVKVGDKIKTKILKLDWEGNRHKLGLKQLAPDPWDTALAEIKEGDIASGRVTKLMEFGAFVEIAEGIEGLVHISELSWQRVAKTSDAIQPNAVVQVKVLKIDPDARKISLSVKQTKEQPAREGGAGGAGGGGRGGKGRGRGDRGEKDTRTPEEILKETPALRRLREKAKQKAGPNKGDKGGLGSAGGLGIGLGDLSL